MAQYEIIPLVLGTIDVDKSYMMQFMHCGTPLTMPVVSFYIKGAPKKILVDTGAPAEVMKKHWPLPSIDIQSFEEALGKQGLKPEDIDIIIQTHLHFDHVGYALKCTKAKVVAQEEEIKFALAPHPFMAGIYGRDLIRGLKFEPVKGDAEVVEGVKVLFTPGHTPGTQSVAVDTAKGTAIITGFCSVRETFEVPAEITQIPCFNAWFVYTPGIHTDALAAFDNALKIKGMADILVPNHEPGLRETKTIP